MTSQAVGAERGGCGGCSAEAPVMIHSVSGDLDRIPLGSGRISHGKPARIKPHSAVSCRRFRVSYSYNGQAPESATARARAGTGRYGSLLKGAVGTAIQPSVLAAGSWPAAGGLERFRLAARAVRAATTASGASCESRHTPSAAPKSSHGAVA